ncbi:DUF748 domain-containing protein [Roseateles sp. DAIF2]|uniref:DUF748 domain-containing protein n=1 Tax=Roseateles sp. DAIF2 TaxID=2714952 RepID=UPI0018A3376B|nr:DUF748 domain-containing protein [Roseateles sp. DAIF2]QPF73855.1 DUF748 domain-containing protein [Roseateles sp. DAIF2]
MSIALSSHPWLRRLLIILAVAVALMGLTMLLLPWWLAGSGMKLASEALGRPTSVGEVRFQPWRLGLVLRDLKISGREAEDPALLEVGELDLALSLRSLWHRSLVLESLTVQRPTLRLARLAEGRYDIDDLIEHWTKPPADPKAESDGPGFALYNLRLSEGQVLLDDRPYQRRHVLDQLRLDLPFLSQLDAHVKVHVEPHLSGRLNAQGFDFGGEALPFAETREAALNLKFADLDLKPYLAYWPRQLPLAPQSGRLSAELRLAFAQAPTKAPELRLSGSLGLRDVLLDQGEQKAWLGWQDLSLKLKELQPLKRQLLIDELLWTGPRLALRRDAAGRVLLPLPPASSKDEGKKNNGKQAAAEPGWKIALQRLELRQAGLDWSDAGVGAELKLQELGLELKGLSWPLQGPAELRFAAALQGPDKAAAAKLDGQGRLGAEALALEAGWQDLALEWLSPYLQAELPLALQGRLAGKAALELARPLEPAPEQRLVAKLRELTLDGLQARQLHKGQQGQELLRLAGLSLDEVSLDPAKRRVELGQLDLREPRLQLRRSAAGVWNVQELLPAPAKPAAATSAEAPWALRLAGLTVERGGLQLSDAAVQPLNRREGEAVGAPYQLVVEQLRLKAQNLSPGQATRSPVQLSLQLGRPGARRGAAAGLGSVQWQGDLVLAPLAARGSLRAERLPLQAFDPYLDPALGLHLRRAEAGFRGDFALSQAAAGLSAQARGDLLLADLRLLQTREPEKGRREVGEELLSWQALNLAGLKLELQPQQVPRVEVAKASLNDFYARLIVNEQGRFNLRDLGPREAAEAAAAAAASAPAAPASAPAAEPAPALRLKLGETLVSNGSVDFSDRFIRPNYSAKLTELQGRLGGFESGSPEMAPLTLKGRVAGTGLLDISGQLNPGTPLAMDIRAAATDIELAPLSPYAGKYAGYAIERGKLSTKVHYRIAAGGQLQADNQIVLNQLSFGEKIDSPDATKLPVLLAVALLKDGNGVIDVNLPVSGSLNDPEFSIGGLVFRLIINLLGKALTSPFSLLMGGGGAEQSHAEFAPASSALQETTQAQLDKVAKALTERPGLNVTLTGWADPQTEKAALQAARVEASLQAERRRELRRQQNASGQAAAEVAEAPLSAAERQRLLRAVYQNSNLPNRPRNFIGLLKEVPAEQMQAMLAASHAVDEEAMRQLALQRAVAVRDALIAKGVPNARLFLAAPHLQAAKAQEDKPWTPRVDLALAAQ